MNGRYMSDQIFPSPESLDEEHFKFKMFGTYNARAKQALGFYGTTISLSFNSQVTRGNMVIFLTNMGLD